MSQRDGLPAVLAARDLGDDLRGDVASGREAVRLLDERAGDDRAVLEHVLEVHEVAVVHVLSVVVGVVEMYDTVVVRINDVLREQYAVCDVPGDLARHIVTLCGVDNRVFVGVLLLGFFIAALDERQYLVIGGVGLAHELTGVAVCDICLCDLERTVCHDLMLDHVLHLLDAGRTSQLLAGNYHAFGDALYLEPGHTDAFIYGIVCLCYRNVYLFLVERHFRAVSLYDLHFTLPPELHIVSERRLL